MDTHEHQRISFCIPYYSSRDLLLAAVDSVLRQRDCDWTLTIIDDASPESAESEIEALNDPRISYIRHDRNRGMVHTWNDCLDAATSELCTLLHCDDELEPDYGRRMLDAARAHPSADAFYCQACVINDQGERCFSFPDWIKHHVTPGKHDTIILKGEDACAKLLRADFIFCPTLCFRTRRHFSPRWKMAPDLDMVISILMDDGCIVGLPDEAYRYRRHRGSTTTRLTVSAERYNEEVEYYADAVERLETRGWRRAARTGRWRVILRLHILYSALGDLLHLRPSISARKLTIAFR